ncbi:MAG TPA: 2-oxoglutarate dehydrogenase complex dihydrolipoyllysine-residue succinyltransferase [Verrucomicrobiae bacterium]|jgi:2-oxoglutarate dehydrogenase E2 component (dihydrolipoamide succinyltransferase)
MPIEIKIPTVGESITEVQISEWLKAEGDSIKQDESLAVIDSEKTTFELPVPQNGKLVKILHQAGETVKVGTVVAQFEAVDEASKAPAPSQKAGAKTATEAKTVKPAAAKKPEEEKVPDEEKAESVETETPPATSKETVATEKPEEKPEPAEPEPQPEADPKSEAEPPPAKAKSASGREQEVVPMTMLRRTIAKHLVEASQMMAMLTTFNEVDMSAVQALRKQHQEAFEKGYQVKLGLMSFFVKAAIDALKKFPKINAEIRGNDIVYPNYFDIGVAIASERGLVVPVLQNAERLSFAELEKAIGDFSRRAQEGKLKPDELQGGTFTITNGGVFGSLFSTPIINSPQTGILGLHTIQERPVAVEGQVIIRPMMYVALTYDHRIVDGREAVLFLRRIKEAIETPSRMLIEI